MNTKKLRWLFIDFNSYFASVEQAINPRLLGKPIAVAPLDTDATCAIAASYEAKAYGIKTGTPIYEAKRMCPGLIVVPAQHKAYVEYHQAIHRAVETCIPITATCSIDEFACRLMDNEQAPEIATGIARNIKKTFLDTFGPAIRASIGIAPNQFLAKQATNLQKPDGLVVLQEHDLPHALYKMDLQDLTGIGFNMAKRLHRAGIYTVEDLHRLPPKQMRAIWGGVGGERYYYRLRGLDFEDPPTVTKTTIGHSRVLSPEFRKPYYAHQVARRLLSKSAARLRRSNHLAKALSLGARMESGKRYDIERRITKTDDSFILLEEMDKIWFSLPVFNERIKKVYVLLSDLDSSDTHISDLLNKENNAAVKRAHLCNSLDQLNQRYGRDTISIGHNVEKVPSKGMGDFGTKIAFTRIPDLEEFRE